MNKENALKIAALAMQVAKTLATVALVHLPLWALRRYAVLPQPLFELDLLIAVMVFSIHRRLGTVAILIAWSLSLVRGVAVNYHFHNVAEFIDSMRFAQMLSYSNYLTPAKALFAMTVIGGIFLAVRLIDLLKPSARGLAAVLVALAITDMANGSAVAIGFGRDTQLVDVNILGTSSYNLLRAEADFLRQGAQPLAMWDPQPSSYRALRELSGEGGSVLVLAESLGWPLNANVRAWLFEQLETPVREASWRIEAGAEEFWGGTVAAELRVLCGMRGHYSRLTPESAAPCLPRQWRERGIPTTAMHGFSPRMFDRSEWWPVVGFGSMRFAESWHHDGHSRCKGSFDAVCDHDVVASALELAAKGGQFVYALTINTHLPLPDAPISASAQAVCARHGIQESICQVLDEQAKLLRDLGNQVAAIRTGVRMVVVVGDHSPPFNSGADRAAFDTKHVPIWVLSR